MKKSTVFGEFKLPVKAKRAVKDRGYSDVTVYDGEGNMVAVVAAERPRRQAGAMQREPESIEIFRYN